MHEFYNASAPKEAFIDSCLRSHYDLQVREIKRLRLGADLEAAVYRAERVDGRSLFIKLSRGDSAGLAFALPAILRDAGVSAVIAPIPTKDGRLAITLHGQTLVVYPFVEGANGFTQPLSKRQWVALGQTLKQIHQTALPMTLRKEIRRETFESPWRDRVALLMKKAVDAVPFDDIGYAVQAFLATNQSTVIRLLAGFERLCQIPNPDISTFVLCHADIHGGNVILDERGQLFVIDWDSPMWAPKERDLMFIGGGVGNVWNQPQEEAFFYEGYGVTPIDQRMLAYYRFERILEDIAIYVDALLFNSGEIENREELLKHFLDLFGPGGVIKIAFETEKALSSGY